MKQIQKGYKAFTGHIFTEHEANLYNAACVLCKTGKLSANHQHHIFCLIVGANKAVTK